MVHYLVAAVSLGSGLFGVLAVASGGGGCAGAFIGALCLACGHSRGIWAWRWFSCGVGHYGGFNFCFCFS